MRSSFSHLILTLVGFHICFPASAALVSRDLFVVDDGLLTYDSQTNLEWLDVDLTIGESITSVQDPSAGWLGLGFEHASSSQICGLFSAYGQAPSPCPDGSGPNGETAFGSIEEVLLFASLFGDTTSQHPNS